MQFLIRSNWNRLNKDTWESLQNLVSFPDDVYVELLTYRLSVISRDEPTKDENVVILNDPARARATFMQLPIPIDEKACRGILHGYFETLKQFPTAISERYRERIAEWVSEHNLRYVVTEECEFKLTIQGLLVSQVEYLKSHLPDADARDRLRELETAVSSIQNLDDARNSMRLANNLLEGILNETAHTPGNTPGRALDRLPQLYPHRALDEGTRKLFKFFDDYPNIRHAGNPGSRLRQLKIDDALLSVALVMSYATFVLDNSCSHSILDGII